jgi:hypothetical protein
MTTATHSPHIARQRGNEMMTDAPELKPCPFCGGGARIYQDPSHSTAWFCGCEDWDCFGNMMWDETKTGATDKWNRRAVLAALDAQEAGK